MFILACAAVTLVSGQLYIEYSATRASTIVLSVKESAHALPRAERGSGAKVSLIMVERP